MLIELGNFGGLDMYGGGDESYNYLFNYFWLGRFDVRLGVFVLVFW